MIFTIGILNNVYKSIGREGRDILLFELDKQHTYNTEIVLKIYWKFCISYRKKKNKIIFEEFNSFK